MDTAHTSDIGWIVIAFVAILIFILIWKYGIDLACGDKKMSIRKINRKIDDSLQDEELRKIIFKKSIAIDEHLEADLRRVVRKIDNKIYETLSSFFNSFLLIQGIISIIKDELNERLDYNNIREKLTSSERNYYLDDILRDIKNAFSTFTLQVLKTNKDEKHPEWDDIKAPIEQILKEFGEEVIKLLIKHIEEKIIMYEAAKTQFKTEEYIKTSIVYPLEKNKTYLQELRG